MSSSMGRILLTGGAGFIGSHLAEALLRRKTTLAIIDDLNQFYSPERKRSNLEEIRRVGEFEFFQADIRQFAALHSIFKRFRPEAVIHLAALAGVRPSIERPLDYEAVNVGGTSIVLELCREFQVRKLVFGSSSSVYGATSVAPFSENHVELRPISPYAATKLSNELMCYTYAHLFGLPVICLRFFTVYGPRQRPDLAIHKFTALLEAGKPIAVFGDGLSGRDYTFVDDIVDGILRSLDYEQGSSAGVPFEIFNLGNSHPVKLLELIEQLERATGRKAIREQKPMQPGDVPLTWANISKAGKLLGYEPKIRLEEGLARFVAWYRATDHSFGA
jgi:UDP-glucuronate 4-epimerase